MIQMKKLKIQTFKPKPAASANKNATGGLFFLEASGGRTLPTSTSTSLRTCLPQKPRLALIGDDRPDRIVPHTWHLSNSAGSMRLKQT